MVKSLFFSYEPIIDLQRTDVFVRNVAVVSRANLIDLVQIGSKIFLGGFIQSLGLFDVSSYFLDLMIHAFHLRQVKPLSHEGIANSNYSFS
jgi:hypothetical protein